MEDVRYQKIWEIYRHLKSEVNITRSGYGLCGIYPYNPELPDKKRSESDLEHSAGVANLVWIISAFFPELIRKEDLSEVLIVSLLHDAGEVAIGDIPDDGSSPHEDKASKELDEIRNLLGKVPFADSYLSNIESLFCEFQEQSSHLGKILYCADKLEAVLQCVIYEQDGRAGDLRYKKEHFDGISKQDQDTIDLIGVTCSTDVWAYHFLKIIDDFEEKKHFVGILRAAIVDVRGEWFTWCE